MNVLKILETHWLYNDETFIDNVGDYTLETVLTSFIARVEITHPQVHGKLKPCLPLISRPDTGQLH